MINLKKRIKEKLLDSPYTIEKLAGECGMTKQTLHNIFNKNDIKLSQLESISQVLGEDLFYFLRDEAVAVNENSGEYKNTIRTELEIMKKENESLKKEIKLLEEMVSILKEKKEA